LGNIDRNKRKYFSDRWDGFVIYQKFIWEGLVAPSTAKFTIILDSYVVNNNGNSWKVQFYFDAQPALG